MWTFLARNKQVAAMLAVLLTAAVVVIVLTTTSSSSSVEILHQDPKDVSDDPHVFATHSLPEPRLMPSVGNGHIATNIFSDTVYLNGLYNGRKGKSHRARIPSWANVRLNSTLTHRPFAPVYSLHTKDGVFKVRVDRDRSVVTQRIYAHRYYTRAIVNQVEVYSKSYADPNLSHHDIWIAVTLMPGADSKDIAFDPPVPEILEDRTVWSTCGKTRESEDLAYQPMPVDVCVYWTSVPDHLVVPQHGSRVFTFAMTVDNIRTVAKQELIKDSSAKKNPGSAFIRQTLSGYDLTFKFPKGEDSKVWIVLQEDGEVLYQKHVREWHALYEQAGVDFEGNLRLSKMVNGIWYYFLSSLPSETSNQPQERFYGLSPTGLARGGTFEDYEGHNFWDTETWMFPSILLLYPGYAKKLLQYRLDTAYAAEDLAKTTGHKGYRYPWESAYTGTEVTQPCCPDVAEYEQHISGCIAFAARQYLATTRDEEWLKHGGCSLVTGIADFWASRAVINYMTGFHDIANVMGPDEDHKNITNSAFTNVVAGYSLYLAQYVSCLCKSYFMTNNTDLWADIAWSLALPYDEEFDYHPQYSGYRRGSRIKQADVVLLGFPLQYPMNKTTRTNDLTYYESVTRSSGPAMTWSMHTVGHLQVDSDRAEHMFNKSYKGYVREPFKVWTELRRPKTDGASNFFTGMGGFLQTLAFGYGGVSIRLDHLRIDRPRLPPGANRFRIRGLKYLGANMTLDIQESQTTLLVAAVDDSWPLTYHDGKNSIRLAAGVTITLTGEGPFTIRSSPWKDCKLPADVIGHTYLRPAGV